MVDTVVEALILDLLEWLSFGTLNRYQQTMVLKRRH
jgi:hypothetical protein